MKVLGMGNALVDILVRLESDQLLETLELPKGSMQLIDEDGWLKIIHELEVYDTVMASGGAAANTICGLSRLGLNCGFIGKTGEDFYGKFYEEDLTGNGVHPHLLKENTPSGCANTFISPDGERTFGTYLGAAANLLAQDLEEKMFEGYDYFFIEGYLIFNEELIRKAVRLAKKAGCKIALDMASYNVVSAKRDFFEEIIRDYADLVFANEEEAYAFTQEEPERSAEIFGQMCEVAVVKVGAHGSWIVRGEEKLKVKAIKAECIDTTGAGDSYAAGFLYGLIKKQPLEICGQIGSLISGNVIGFIGPKMDDERWKIVKKEIHSLLQ